MDFVIDFELDFKIFSNIFDEPITKKMSYVVTIWT